MFKSIDLYNPLDYNSCNKRFKMKLHFKLKHDGWFLSWISAAFGHINNDLAKLRTIWNFNVLSVSLIKTLKCAKWNKHKMKMRKRSM